MRKLSRNAEESEKSIEDYLVRQVRIKHGVCLKFSSPWRVGCPDRLVMIPGGITMWVEVKSRGKHPTPLQMKRHEELRALGQRVETVSSRAEVDNIIRINHAF